MPSAAPLAALAGAESASTLAHIGWLDRLGSFLFAESPLSCSRSLGSWLAARLGWQEAPHYSLLRLVDASSQVGDAERMIVLLLYGLLTMLLLVVLWSLALELRDPFDLPDLKDGRAAATPAPPPPLLCPALVPHAGGAQFQVAMDALQMLKQGISPAQVLGPMATPVMHAWLVRDDGGRFGARDPSNSEGGRSGLWLELTTSPTRRDVQASVGPLEATGQEPVEVLGPGGNRYGLLESSRHGCHVLRHGVPLLTISSSGAFPNLKVTAADGSAVAAAAPSATGTINGAQKQNLVLHVFPRADAALVLLCVLAAVSMSPELTKVCSAPTASSQRLLPPSQRPPSPVHSLIVASEGAVLAPPDGGEIYTASAASTPTSYPQQ